MNRIKSLFSRKNRDLLSVFYTAGFPRLEDTVPIGKSLAESGADLVEIGIPFSDPVADGPVIQQSNKQALENGMHVKLLLDQVRELRRSTDVPILLMGYLNPVLQFGADRFCKTAAAAGVDGLILPDLPVREYETEFEPVLSGHGLDFIFLISPTTSEARVRKIDGLSRSFIYAVSASSTTGARSDLDADQLAYLERLRNMKLNHPVMTGFGISNHQTFSKACEYAAGAIVGSAFISRLAQSKNYQADIAAFIKEIRG